MESEKKLFRIAGILYGILGVVCLTFPVYGIYLMLCGVYFYSQAYEQEETIYKNRILNYILASIGLLNVIGAILIYIAQSGIDTAHRLANGINAPPKVIYKRDKESRKIDILIKLGVGMIFVAGLLFATTSWDFINDYFKAFGLIIFAFVFMGLSIFTETKLKLYRSAYMYWLLSMSLFVLTIIGVLYFGIFGIYLKYSGGGRELAYAITYLTVAGLLLTTYFKYPKKYLLFFSYGSMIVALSYFLGYANLSQMTIVSVISVVLMVLNTISKNKVLNTFSKILSYMLFGAILVVGANNNVEGLIACLINIVNLNYLTWIDKKKEESTINVLISYALIIFGMAKFTDMETLKYSMMALVSTVYTLCIMGNVVPTKNITKRINTCVYSLIMLTLFLITINGYELADTIAYIGIPIIFLGINWITKKGLWNVEKWKFANYVQPFIIFMLVKGIIRGIDFTISEIYVYSFLAIIYSIMHCLYHDELDKKIVGFYSVCATFIGLTITITSKEMYASLMLIISSLYMFTRSYLDNKEDTLSKVWLLVTYMILLTSLYIPFVHYNLLNISVWITSLGFIVLILCMIPFLKNEWLSKLSYVYIFLPMSNLFHQAGLDENLILVLESIEKLYLVFLFLKFFVKDAKFRNIVIIVGVVVSCFKPFWVQSIYTGMYIGILGILLVIYGFRKEDAYPVFISGIILTVLNIVYYLQDVWKNIPFWLYLLVGGIVIIGFATYKEMQKIKKDVQKTNKS